MSKTPAAQFVPLSIAVLTVSDTRTTANDTSGDLLADRLISAGHALAARGIVRDDIYQMRARVSALIADTETQVILITGGTGFSHRPCNFVGTLQRALDTRRAESHDEPA
ncbi:putative molybdopterin binding protein [Marinobacterium halophilum]|uniref:Molybdenum cofactor biosynthesis protein B n=1 Tax=Marinobacterium halophilum TaxID=267374 RepID=A0A2P8F3G0_9GAMM|nr:putative molybdopterin binding protein [Marinobacterium halophilum]